MTATVFDKICIVGSGTIAVHVCKQLMALRKKICVLLFKEHPVSLFSLFLKKNGIAFCSFDDKTDLEKYLTGIDEKTLIISANNTYLFPASVVHKPNFKIVNFHNALLPAHKGMNAPCWSIYEQDEKAGITWHIVNEKIDDGSIITQKEIALTGRETAFSLIKQLMSLAAQAFDEIKNDLLNWSFIPYKIAEKGQPQIHRAKDIPNGGILDLNWDAEKASAFLRSLDWGALDVFPLPVVTLNGETIKIKQYKITPVHENRCSFRVSETTLLLTGKEIEIIITLGISTSPLPHLYLAESFVRLIKKFIKSGFFRPLCGGKDA